MILGVSRSGDATSRIGCGRSRRDVVLRAASSAWPTPPGSLPERHGRRTSRINHLVSPLSLARRTADLIRTDIFEFGMMPPSARCRRSTPCLINQTRFCSSKQWCAAETPASSTRCGFPCSMRSEDGLRSRADEARPDPRNRARRDTRIHERGRHRQSRSAGSMCRACGLPPRETAQCIFRVQSFDPVLRRAAMKTRVGHAPSYIRCKHDRRSEWNCFRSSCGRNQQERIELAPMLANAELGPDLVRTLWTILARVANHARAPHTCCAHDTVTAGFQPSSARHRRTESRGGIQEIRVRRNDRQPQRTHTGLHHAPTPYASQPPAHDGQRRSQSIDRAAATRAPASCARDPGAAASARDRI